MSVIVCGVDPGVTHKYRCPCCGYESDNIENFATSSCWPCVYGNPKCANCLQYGVWVSQWIPRGRKAHRLATDGSGKTRCGLRFKATTGTYGLERCRKCALGEDTE